MINTGIKLFCSLFIFAAFSASIFAQIPQQPQGEVEEVTDEELEKFVDIQQMIQEKNSEMQPKMMSTIEENGFETQRYIELNQAEEMGQEMDADEEEVARYQKTKQTIMELQKEANETIVEGIEEKGLTVERYQQINMAIQQDPDLQEKMRDMM